MKPFRCCLMAMSVLLLPSCGYLHKAYYMSPADIRATPYVTLPMAADPEKTVTAVAVAFDAGTSNQEGRDKLIGGTANFIQSHHFGHFQAYYGAALGMGDYDNGKVNVGAVYGSAYDENDSAGYKIPSVKKFFGYYGLNGGVNVVVPFANGKGEWRAFGIDVSYRKEFGDYLDFRRSQPADKIDILAGYGHLFTIGGSTEIVGRNSRDYQFGYKVALGSVLRPAGQYTGKSNGELPYYFSNTFQITKSRVTGFMQVTIGARATVFQTGININLRKRTTLFPVPVRPPRKARPARDSTRPRHRRPFEKAHRDESGDHD